MEKQRGLLEKEMAIEYVPEMQYKELCTTHTTENQPTHQLNNKQTNYVTYCLKPGCQLTNHTAFDCSCYCSGLTTHPTNQLTNQLTNQPTNQPSIQLINKLIN